MAIVIAILFKRPFKFLMKIFRGNKYRASVFTLVLVVLIIIIPLFIIGIMITREVSSGYSLFKNNWSDIKFYVEHLPDKIQVNQELKLAIDRLDWDKIAESTNSALGMIAEFVLSLVQKTFYNMGVMILHFFVVVFLLYYILIDGDSLVKKIQYIIPLKDSDEQLLFEKFNQVIGAIVFNSLVIGVIEGTYGGLLFGILGISSPFFWGMIMTFLSIIPIVGANSVMVPMSFYQIITGNITVGIIILVLGAGAIVVNQNIIKPRLDGNKSGIHPAIMFLASMGGLLVFGVIGFIIGPIITAIFLLFLELFGRRYKNQLIEHNKN